ncbi:[protein-PII] uridylyltransferase [Corynebacterium sp. 3HC-13]|uniref:[protein-PII] uridylyltransferase n=1 Tax=Corynebacterium poyangense TaxID=2684405 RepID=UPI001CCE0F70|nr:[protein-PII] uridylyltransferase [Corynebacterium poyangense]MBZ8178076.1 [protein-PII] uridylyltransferase [Corynebacterium poyangense]
MTTPPYKRAAQRLQEEEALLWTLPLPEGTALAATGSLARRELTIHSDLDLLLLHEPGCAPTEEELAQIWYPLWDAGKKIDYAVRTPDECGAIVNHDVTAGLALLDLRHISGAEELSLRARQSALKMWRRAMPKNFDAVVDSAIKRWRRAGSVVAMTRPDLKQGRGGLRDVDLIRAISLAHLADAPPLGQERELIIKIRACLHEHLRRSRDILDPEYAGDIAHDLGYESRYDLIRDLVSAGKKIDEALTEALAGARTLLNRRQPWYRRSSRRRPLELDVVESEGRVTLSREPNFEDPGLPLRVAASATRYGLPIDPGVWARLARTPVPPEPWLKVQSADFIAVLASSEWSPHVVAELDAHGLWERFVPDWQWVRGRRPAEPIHIHSIDNHLLATVAECARRSVQVARPDLLLLGALFHDIGKGYGRPHEQVGAEKVARMAARLGFHYQDRSRVQTLVAEHTTLSRLVAQCDIYDPRTVDTLLEAVHHDILTLELLGVLTEADALATGPGVWNARLERGRDHLIARGREELQRLHYLSPAPPMVRVPGELGVHPECEDGFPVVYWRGEHQRQSIRILALCAAKAWNIEAARMVRVGEQVQAELVVRPTAGRQTIDPNDLIQTYRSGVHTVIPQIQPRPCAIYWHESIIEIRTPDQPGVFGEILRVLPEADWIELKNIGDTLIVRSALSAPINRAETERNVTRALGNS